jgi:hypothetical protein
LPAFLTACHLFQPNFNFNFKSPSTSTDLRGVDGGLAVPPQRIGLLLLPQQDAGKGSLPHIALKKRRFLCGRVGRGVGLRRGAEAVGVVQLGLAITTQLLKIEDMG